ncbi:S [Symbiodinium natans]|uniref:S protein n=1 Tax=Symbiodinium natans TaxID=878477 RepID=A0A812Q8R4_9DINO|nr:S [Symbiodinium natans] [Symbiodinium natans]
MGVEILLAVGLAMGLVDAAGVSAGDPQCWTGISAETRKACCADPGSGWGLGCWYSQFFFERCCLGSGAFAATCIPSQSQFGEELVVIEFFGWQTKRDGVYVEIGALDGFRYSNTLVLQSCLGWTGMLIEGSPRNYEALRRNLASKRPKNVVTHFGAVCAPPLTNATFLKGQNDNAVDGDARHLSETVVNKNIHRHRVAVPCKPMSWYLRSLPGKHVDFLSLDVEGAELEVLLTINFTEVTVEVFMIELHELTVSDQVQNWKIRNLLQNLGYRECKTARVKYSGVFARRHGQHADRC